MVCMHFWFFSTCNTSFFNHCLVWWLSTLGYPFRTLNLRNIFYNKNACVYCRYVVCAYSLPFLANVCCHKCRFNSDYFIIINSPPKKQKKNQILLRTCFMYLVPKSAWFGEKNTTLVTLTPARSLKWRNQPDELSDSFMNLFFFQVALSSWAQTLMLCAFWLFLIFSNW